MLKKTMVKFLPSKKESYTSLYKTLKGEYLEVVKLGQLILNKETNEILVNKNSAWSITVDTDILVPHDLYFLSLEKVSKPKEDIYYYDSNTNLVTKWKGECQTYTENYFSEVIATTDESLNVQIFSDNEENAGFGGYYIWKDGIVGNPQYLSKEEYRKLCLPKPSQSFINKFIKKWNNNIPIQYVNVDYEEKIGDEGIIALAFKEDEYKLKVDKNNEITITPIKDSWSREELQPLKDYYEHSKLFARSNDYREQDVQRIFKWIEENL